MSDEPPKSKMEIIEANVQKILRDDPDTRESNNWFIGKYLAVYEDRSDLIHGLLLRLSSHVIIEELTDVATLLRIKKKFQDEGHYLPSKRKMNEKMRHELKAKNYLKLDGIVRED